MTPSTLLWLFAHGDVFWQAALAALGLGAAVVAYLRSRAKLRSRLAELRAQMEEGVVAPGELRAGPVLLDGRLDAAGAERSAGGLVLVVGEESIPMDGDVEILAGSSEAPWRDNAAKSVDLTLSPGDRVWAAGVLERRTPEPRGGYRAPALQWRLVPPPGGAVSLAVNGAPPISGARFAISIVQHFAPAALLFFLVAAVLGAFSRGSLDPADNRPISAQAAAKHAAVAAMSPFHRAGARAALHAVLMTRAADDPDAWTWLTAIVEGDAARRELASWAISRGKIARGAEIAEAAGETLTAAEAWYSLGDFQRASRALTRAGSPVPSGQSGPDFEEQTRFAVRVHLLAGRLAEAAAEARALAAHLAPQTAFSGRARLARCLADALDARQKDDGARDRLSRATQRDCVVLFADLLQGPARAAFLDPRRAELPRLKALPDRWFELLRAEVDPNEAARLGDSSRDDTAIFCLDPARALRSTLPAVERAILDALSAPPLFGARPRHASRALAEDMSVFAALGGDRESATRYLDTLRDASEVHGPDAPAVRAAAALDVPAAVALLRGDEPSFDVRRIRSEDLSSSIVWLLIARASRDRAELVEIGAPDHGPLAPRGRDALRVDMESRGLGAVLQERLPASASEPRGVEAAARMMRIMGAAIGVDRGNVLPWIRAAAPSRQRSPLGWLVVWSDLAAAATSLGEPALGAELLGRAARFYAALMSRELSVPLAVLEAG